MADSETVILGKREHHTLLYLVILCWKYNSSFLMCSLKWGLLVMAQLGVHGNLIITQCGCQDHLLRNFGQSFRCVPVTLCCVLGCHPLKVLWEQCPRGMDRGIPICQPQDGDNGLVETKARHVW